MSNNSLLGIFAPYPRKKYLTDGWYRRIYLIDQIFAGIPRVYINTLHIAPKNTSVITHPNGTMEVFLSPKPKRIQSETQQILSRIKFNYIHTTHLGKDFLDLNNGSEFIVDFHGAAPEEESLQGNLEMFHSLNSVEKILYNKAKAHVFVSKGMAQHFKTKYQDHKIDYLLPIISEVRLNTLRVDIGLTDRLPGTYVYAGGVQPWQNVSEMLESVARKKKQLRVATNQLDKFNTLYPKKTYPFCDVQEYNAENLLKLYASSSFGYVLRDDSIVNQVAFPTKLFEYISCGVIPVMKYKGLGGLDQYGLFSIGVEEEVEKLFTSEELDEHRAKNHRISLKVVSDFLEHASQMRETITIGLNERN
jgi:hypothetical protein